eukprot:c22433_g1_i1 orf=399-2063(+)
MFSRRPRHPLHPTLRTLAAGGRQWARGAGQVVACRLLGGLFLLVLIFSRTILSPQMLHPTSRVSNVGEHPRLDRLMLITLEFKKSTFSGNGVYAQSIARSLARRGHEILVLSAKPGQSQNAVSPKASPAGSTGVGDRGEANKVFDLSGTTRQNGKYAQVEESSSSKAANQSMEIIDEDGVGRALLMDSVPGLIEIEVEVEQEGWGRLDWKCPWQSFAQNISEDVVLQVAKFNPSWVLVVDWSALPALLRLAKSIGNCPWQMAFLNFRIYCLSEYKGNDGEKEKQFYKTMESQAVAMASAVTALSSRDAHILATELGAGIAPGVVPTALFPPIRDDIRLLALARRKDEDAQSTGDWLEGRKYFTCVVPLLAEKNAELFVSLVEVLSSFLDEQGIIPFLCGGAHGDNAYAGHVKSRLKTAMPQAVIYDGIMGPMQLSELYMHTLLNVHPCIDDAYGMTVIEAAAFAVPSVMHVGPRGAVGAAEFLDPNEGQVLPLDLTTTVATLSDSIKRMLLDQTILAQIGWAASKRSLSWNEDANAEQLVSILKSAHPHVFSLI